jgi:hypothetical protein
LKDLNINTISKEINSTAKYWTNCYLTSILSLFEIKAFPVITNRIRSFGKIESILELSLSSILAILPVPISFINVVISTVHLHSFHDIILVSLLRS